MLLGRRIVVIFKSPGGGIYTSTCTDVGPPPNKSIYNLSPFSYSAICKLMYHRGSGPYQYFNFHTNQPVRTCQNDAKSTAKSMIELQQLPKGGVLLRLPF